MKQTTPDEFIAAAALVRAGWTQRAFARDADGKQVWCKSPDAVTFSLDGALRRIVDSINWQQLRRYILVLEDFKFPTPVHYNDAEGRTAEECAVMLEMMGEMARGEAGRKTS